MTWQDWTALILVVYAVVGVIVGSAAYHLADPNTRWDEHEFHWACGYMWPLLLMMVVPCLAGLALFKLTGVVIQHIKHEERA